MVTLRQRAFQVLTSLDLKTLEKLTHKALPKYSVIKPAEVGLITLRGRVGNSGDRFNVGDLLVTKCSVMVNDKVGYGYVAGDNGKIAEIIAVMDAMIQTEKYVASAQKILNKAQKIKDKALAKKLALVAASKVEFYTMVRGED